MTSARSTTPTRESSRRHPSFIVKSPSLTALSRVWIFADTTPEEKAAEPEVNTQRGRKKTRTPRDSKVYSRGPSRNNRRRFKPPGR